MIPRRDPGSFRDPSGFVYEQHGVIYRQINTCYKENYESLMSSGLYEHLIHEKMLISHEVVNKDVQEPGYLIIKPERVPFISYPYEWCFSQLKDAALLTLDIQSEALKRGMSLKDASAFNVQFISGRPLFIDSLSFEKYVEGKPWIAYRQFCQHFLAPLLLMAYGHIRSSCLLKNWVDGIPLDLASSFLPWRTYLSPACLMHVHLHSKSQKRYGSQKLSPKKSFVSKSGLFGIVDNLRTVLHRLKPFKTTTEWEDYYEHTNYNMASLQAKKKMVGEFLDLIPAKSVWDIGGNTGFFSRVASSRGLKTISFDIDHNAVELNYRTVRAENDENLLPLVMDFVNPSSRLGWACAERLSLLDRGPADVGIALAFIHHMAIGNNVPLEAIAQFMKGLCRYLIIEFVPKGDSQVDKMLRTREDIFADYTQENFEESFSRHFEICRNGKIPDSRRTLYLIRAKS